MKETIKNLWTIVAQSSAVDRDSNSLSLFDIVEEITFQVGGVIPDKAVLPFNLQVVSLWERDEVGTDFDLKLKIILRDPKNQILHEGEGAIKMEPTHKRFRLRAQFQGFPVTVPGTYRYEIISAQPEKTDGKELLATASMDVKIAYQAVISPIQPTK